MQRAMTAVGWLTPPAAERDFIRWREWSGVVLALYLLVRAPVLTSSVGSWRPVGVLFWRGGAFSQSALWALWAVALVGAAGLLRPLQFLRTVTPLGAIAALVLFTHRSSGGQILWFDILPALHLLVLGAAGTRFNAIRAGWGMRLASLITIVTYVLAGIAKLRIGGIDWIAEGALERQIAFSATRFEVLGGTPSPVAEWLLDLRWASIPLAVAVLLIELGAPLALLSRRAAWIWSISAWVMHVVIAVTMFVVFHWPLFGVAFVPLLLCPPGNKVASCNLERFESTAATAREQSG